MSLTARARLRVVELARADEHHAIGRHGTAPGTGPRRRAQRHAANAPDGDVAGCEVAVRVEPDHREFRCRAAAWAIAGTATPQSPPTTSAASPPVASSAVRASATGSAR
jgi:hypothetical protein